MNAVFDHHTMNHMVTAISQEMNLCAAEPRAECDALFIGGPVPLEDNQVELAQFGLRKNWKIVYPSFDLADVRRGPTSFHVVVTDGLTETMVLQEGRLWKKDATTAAILLFSLCGIVVRISSKGRLLVEPLRRAYHDHGYDLAMRAVTARAARAPGHIPILSTIGNLPTVLDIRTMNHAFAMAA
jgi:hypothetical protein